MSASAPTLEDLAARVAALEDELSDLAATDTLQSNVVTVTPGGGIGVKLTGGLQLQGAATSPTAENAIQWISAGSGAVVADITEFHSVGGDENLNVELITPGPVAYNSRMRLISRISDNSASAELDLNAKTDSNATAITGSVQSSIGNQPFTLLDAAGNSDFVQGYRIPASARRQVQSSAAESYLGGTTHAAVAGWQQTPMDSLNFDPSSLLVNNGTGYYLQAPVAGLYLTATTAEVTNNTGGNIDYIVGFNNTYIGWRTQLGNTWVGCGTAFRIWNLAAGGIVYPSIYTNTVAGFGVPFAANACWFDAWKIA